MSNFIDVDINENEENVIEKKIEKTRRPYSVWTVGGRDYKLRLTAADSKTLEKEFKQNVLSAIYPDEGIPPLLYLLRTVQVSTNKFEHGITKEKVEGLYDEWIDEGHTFDEFYSDVIMPIFTASGFFSETQMEKAQAQAAEIKANQ